jgi:hypothetical protein
MVSFEEAPDEDSGEGAESDCISIDPTIKECKCKGEGKKKPEVSAHNEEESCRSRSRSSSKY